MFWSTQNRTCSITASGWVKSTATWLPASASENSQSPNPTAATRSRSAAASTARQTSDPIRPRAPITPTRKTSSVMAPAPFLSGPPRVAARSMLTTGSARQPVSSVNSTGRSSVEAYGPTTAAVSGRFSNRPASAATWSAVTALMSPSSSSTDR